ncbi:MAG: hypothetical protein Q7R35_15130 [Elusimicrobiota bacterium]|nr:hypothetical protein [Elusimicrobiota bacterium]
MKIEISPALFGFELEQLFATRQGAAQFAFIQFIIWFSSYKQAADLYGGSADYWSNYILIRGFCQALILNAVVAMELFVKPKTDKTIEMLLVTGLSPQTIVTTNVAVSLLYNAVSLLVCFGLLAFTIGRVTFSWVHLISFTVLLLANLAVLIWTGFFALQTKYGSQLAGLFIVLSVLLLLVTGLYQYSVSPAPAFQAALAAGAALLALVSSFVFKLFDKEKILLS